MVKEPGSGRVLYPAEFRQMCLSAARELYLAEPVARRMAEYRQRIDPDVVAMHEAAYAAPLSVARMLYGDGYDEDRREMMAAIRNLHGDCLAAGLAAGAREAVLARDWRMFGWLCFQVDAALARSFDPTDDQAIRLDDGETSEDPDDSEQADGPLDLLAEKFHAAVRLIIKRPDRQCWLETVQEYLMSLPASFLPPADLGGLGGASDEQVSGDENMGLLRLLVSPPRTAWSSDRSLQTNLMSARSPFVKELVIEKLGPDAALATPNVASGAPRGERLSPVPDDHFDQLLNADDDPAQFTPPPPEPVEPGKGDGLELGPLPGVEDMAPPTKPFGRKAVMKYVRSRPRWFIVVIVCGAVFAVLLAGVSAYYLLSVLFGVA